MRQLLLLFTLFLFLSGSAIAQLFPAENARLHYRVVGFRVGNLRSNADTRIEVARGAYYSADSFMQNIVSTVVVTGNFGVVEVPSFGVGYTWRYITKGRSSELHHFYVAGIPETDTAKQRLRIMSTNGKYDSSYFFMDGSKVLYNGKGQPVWFIPDIESLISNTSGHRGHSHAIVHDLKLTNTNTITFILGDDAYEIDYNGKVLWTAPNDGKVSGGKEEEYHHQLTKLRNGHYMVLGNELVNVTVTDQRVAQGITMQQTRSFGTIIEYDKDGNVVWSWKSSKFFKDKNFSYKLMPNGRQEAGIYESGFYFDEVAKVVYVNFKNINKVVTIKYPEGDTIGFYGRPYEMGEAEGTNNIFCGQTGCKLTAKGYLLLYNNNTCNIGERPKVIMFSEPAQHKGALRKVWEYNCGSEVATATVPENTYTLSGGNAVELPDNNVFVSMSKPYANVFVVAPDKKILWNALPEKWNSIEEKWEPLAQYRVSHILNNKLFYALIGKGFE